MPLAADVSVVDDVSDDEQGFQSVDEAAEPEGLAVQPKRRRRKRKEKKVCGPRASLYWYFLFLYDYGARTGCGWLRSPAASG